MKKLTLLAILVVAILASSVSAQSGDLTNAQKMTPFAVGMSLSVLGEMYDENYQNALSEYQKNIRYYSAELKPVVDLKENASSYDRLDIAQTATKSLRAKSSKSDRWQMLVGEQFGVIYVQIKKNKTDGDEINADDLKFSLELIATLAANAPEDIPEDIVKQFKKVGALKDRNDLASDEGIEKITDEVIKTLRVISN